MRVEQEGKKKKNVKKRNKAKIRALKKTLEKLKVEQYFQRALNEKMSKRKSKQNGE